MFAAASNSTGLVLTLPANFLYVGLVGVGTFWLNIFQASVVSKLRKSVSPFFCSRDSVSSRIIADICSTPRPKANIKYPQHMAEVCDLSPFTCL